MADASLPIFLDVVSYLLLCYVQQRHQPAAVADRLTYANFPCCYVTVAFMLLTAVCFVVCIAFGFVVALQVSVCALAL